MHMLVIFGLMLAVIITAAIFVNLGSISRRHHDHLIGSAPRSIFFGRAAIAG